MIDLGDRTAYWMLLLYCFLLPFASIIWKPLADVVFIIMLINCVIMYSSEKVFEFDRFLIILALFFLYSLLTIVWSAYRLYAISTNISIAKRVGLAICVYGIIDSKSRIEAIFRCFLLGGFFLLIYMLMRYGIDGIAGFLISESRSRLGEDITSANTIGSAFSLAALSAWYFVTRDEKTVINMTFFSVFFLFVLASGSRAAFFGLVVGMLTCSFCSSKSGTLARIVIAILVIIGLYEIVKYLNLMPGVISRFDEALLSIFGNAEISGSARSRVEFAEYGFNKIVKNPIFGYGAGQFRYYMGVVKGMAFSAHNNYVEVLFSYGIIGGGIWYGMFFYSICKLWKYWRQSENAMLIALLLMRMVSDIAGHSIATSRPYLFLALAFSCLRIEERETHIPTLSRKEEKACVRKSYIRANSPFR